MVSLRQNLLSKKSSGLFEDSAGLFLKKFCLCFGVVSVSFLFATPVFAYTSPGHPSGYVNDFAHVLKAGTITQLDAELQNFEASTSNQIAVVTVPDMGGDYIENYSVQLFKEWGIGQKDKNNGVLLLLSVQEHAIRIEVGYGLEGALPDSVAQSIIAGDLTPNLKANDYDTAVLSAVHDIEAATQNEYQGTGNISSDLSVFFNNAGFIFFALLLVFQWMAALLARSKSWWAGGVLGMCFGVGFWVFFSLFLVWGLLLVGALTGLGLLFDYIISKGYSKAKDAGVRVPWWFGGGGFGGGRGGGFGGFGGGGSGGGGASGGW